MPSISDDKHGPFVVVFAPMTPRSISIGRWLASFAAFLAAVAVGFGLPSLGAHLSLPLLPSGAAVAACVRWGRKMWTAIFAAAIVVEVWMHQAPLEVLGVAIGAAGSAVLTAWILERRGFDANFGRARDVPLFILAGALGMVLIPTFGLLGMGLSGDTAEPVNSLHWVRWWSNSTAGVLLVGPLLVAASRESLVQFAEHWAEGCLWLLGVAICCGGSLTFAPAGAGRPLILTLSMFLVVVGAIRFGLVVSAFGALAMSAAAGLSFAFGIGIFGRLEELAGFATIWGYSAALTGLGLIITSLLAERDSAGLERLQAERRYAQIFNASPQPLWVHDPATLEFLLVNDAAVRQYGWSREQFLHRRVPALATAGSASVLPVHRFEAGIDSFAEPFETRHLTQDGRVLAVEVWTRAIDLGGRRAELVFASDVTERRALGSALIGAIADEQRRIGRELHDGLGQELTGLALSARALATRAERELAPIAASLDQLAGLATSCIQAANRIAQGVSPLSDSDGNLQAALEGLARRSSLGGTAVRFRPRLDARLSIDLEARNHLYRIAQEAVQNALKHAGARSVDIELHSHAGGVTLTIDDDGVGMPGPGSRGNGLGMRTMRFRASSIGGRLLIGSRAGGGVSVVCEVVQSQDSGAAAAEPEPATI